MNFILPSVMLVNFILPSVMLMNVILLTVILLTVILLFYLLTLHCHFDKSLMIMLFVILLRVVCEAFCLCVILFRVILLNAILLSVISSVVFDEGHSANCHSGIILNVVELYGPWHFIIWNLWDHKQPLAKIGRLFNNKILQNESFMIFNYNESYWVMWHNIFNIKLEKFVSKIKCFEVLVTSFALQ